MELNGIEGELAKNIVIAPPKKALIKVKKSQQVVLCVKKGLKWEKIKLSPENHEALGGFKYVQSLAEK